MQRVPPHGRQVWEELGEVVCSVVVIEARAWQLRSWQGGAQTWGGRSLNCSAAGVERRPVFSVRLSPLLFLVACIGPGRSVSGCVSVYAASAARVCGDSFQWLCRAMVIQRAASSSALMSTPRAKNNRSPAKACESPCDTEALQEQFCPWVRHCPNFASAGHMSNVYRTGLQRLTQHLLDHPEVALVSGGMFLGRFLPPVSCMQNEQP